MREWIMSKLKGWSDSDPKEADVLFSREQVLETCQIDDEGLEILRSTEFSSQSKFNHRRGLRVANILNDMFSRGGFKGKRILELGPGHYAFALLARSLGAEVVCVERDPAFVALGRHLGFEVLDEDFRELCPEMAGGTYDGLWVKGTFNACNYADDEGIQEFVDRLTSVVTPEGWAWCVTVNKDTTGKADDHFVRQRVEEQRKAFARRGWDVCMMEESWRPRYACNYKGCLYLYSRNLGSCYRDEKASDPGRELYVESPPAVEADPRAGQGKTPVKVARDVGGGFVKYQRIWKPTSEYYPNPWRYYQQFIEILKAKGVRFLTMSDALRKEHREEDINVILDHHIDFYPVETEIMCRWEHENEVVSSVYLFNRYPHEGDVQPPWSIKDLNIPFYQQLERDGFEIGYHQNAVGQAKAEAKSLRATYPEAISETVAKRAKEIFERDVEELRKHFNLRTFIPHGAGEGNAKLLDVPESCRDLVWVYNNAKKNNTVDPPISWVNYSDSCSAAPQRLQSDFGQYIARVDNLHLWAHLLVPGTYHILIHPGRFAKGMLYEQYGGKNMRSGAPRESEEFRLAGDASHRLPLKMNELVGQWERPEAREIREKHEMLSGPEYSHEKPYLVTDSVWALWNGLAKNETVTAVYVHHNKITPAQAREYRVPRPTPMNVHVPQKPVDLVIRSEEEWGRLFMEEFKAFYNLVFSPHILRHLGGLDFCYDQVVLNEIRLERKGRLSHLAEFLLRYAGSESRVHLRGVVEGCDPGEASALFKRKAEGVELELPTEAMPQFIEGGQGQTVFTWSSR
jgi:hypothetical protein